MRWPATLCCGRIGTCNVDKVEDRPLELCRVLELEAAGKQLRSAS